MAHPDINGYTRPFTVKERLMHVAEARRTLGSKIPWICDAMDNEIATALGGSPNSEFIIGPDGKVLNKWFWSNPRRLRRELAKLVGEVKKPTTAADLKLPIPKPLARAPRGIVQRLTAPPGLAPLVVEPVIEKGKPPFYAKLRAEAEKALLEEGKGKLYLGFFLDPLYRVHWNNQVDPLKVELVASDETSLTPSKAVGPTVKVPADSDPREFLLQVETIDLDSPLKLTVRYMACDDAETFCLPVTQKYVIRLAKAKDAGARLTGGGSPIGSSFKNYVAQLMKDDKNKDGKLQRDEFPKRLRIMFDLLDVNEDRHVDVNELKAMEGRFRGDQRPAVKKGK